MLLSSEVLCEVPARVAVADCFQFLAFFRMAIKFLAVTLFFALTVLKPVHDAFPLLGEPLPRGNDTQNNTSTSIYHLNRVYLGDDFDTAKKKGIYHTKSNDYLWMYVVFAYVFTALAIYLMVTETVRIIRVRQDYLGTQSTVTDKTIKLSGIPPDLRSEEKIKAFIENLQIGKVDSVMLCKQWEELDNTMARRMELLRKLEEAWTVSLGKDRVERNQESLPISQPPPARHSVGENDDDEDSESGPLLDTERNGSAGSVPDDRARPTTTIRSGFMKLQGRKVDAIDYYEEKLRIIDEKILELRKKDFEPTPLAFVTMESVAACVSNQCRAHTSK